MSADSSDQAESSGGRLWLRGRRKPVDSQLPGQIPQRQPDRQPLSVTPQTGSQRCTKHTGD